MRCLAALLGAVLWSVAAAAGPVPFDRDLAIPPVIEDATRPVECTVAYLIVDASTNDVFAARMRIASRESDKPLGGFLPCPSPVPPRLAVRALDVCAVRVDDPNKCVFADMGRAFENEPAEHNTSSNGSRCSSDKADFIGLACRRAGARELCAVGCGRTEADAVRIARARCEEKHQQSCPIRGAVPVLAP